SWAAVAAVAAIIWLIMPIGVGILIGTLLAFMAQPLFEHWKRRLGVAWSALATVAVSMIILVASLGGLAWLFVARGTVLSRQLIETVNSGTGDDVVSAIARVTDRIGIPRDEIVSHLRSFANDAAGSAAGIAETIASTTGDALLGLLFATLAMHFMLRNWDDVSRRLQEALPLRADYTASLMAEFRRVGRTTLLGAIGTAAAQGAFATVGFWIAGVPEPIFFGAATAMTSFVPAVGVLLVLVPVGVGLVLAGHSVSGVFELAWGLVVVVGVCDYVIRPRLVRGEDDVPSIVTFAALFGGVEVLGLKGLVIGPLVMALSLAVLRLYASEAGKRRQVVVAAG
ncbi:MAG TPA: AI-2E family transporter, partial [Kofleriaceae bacterium]|nr:AI-2E family transporter [Kofleriaceae bacterium]